MSCILSIETSTDICSVAVSQNGVCIYEKVDRSGPNHAVVLGTFVDQALSFLDGHLIPLDAVAVSSGPGSYTGLRIGTSMAKGISYGRSVKLLSVPTLQLMCVPILLQEQITDDKALLCPMLDAKRMEVYAQIFDRGLNEIRPILADVVDAETYLPYLEEHPVYFFGNGADKCKDVIQHPNAHFINGVVPLAKNMFPLAEKRMMNEQFEDVAYFVPFYLKDFVAKQAKKLI